MNTADITAAARTLADEHTAMAHTIWQMARRLDAERRAHVRTFGQRRLTSSSPESHPRAQCR